MKGFSTPRPLSIDVLPQQKNAPVIGLYERAKGKLSVRYFAPVPEAILEKTVCTVKNRSGYSHVAEGSLGLGSEGKNNWNRLEIDDLKPGEYEISFSYKEIPGFFDEEKTVRVEVVGDETCVIDQLLEPKFASLDVKVTLPPALLKETWRPAIYLKDEFGQIVTQVSDLRLKESRLLPGNYEIHFEGKAGLKALAPLSLHLKPGQKESFSVSYTARLGNLVLRYESEMGRLFLDQVKFTLSAVDGRTYPCQASNIR